MKEWVNEAAERLKHSDNRNTANVAVALAQFPIENPLIMHLGSLLHSVLEKNAPVETVLEMKLQMASIVEECGIMLHNVFPFLTPEEGASTMLTLYALFNGLFQMTSSSERLKQELTNRNIEIFNINYAETMVTAATIFLEGMHIVKQPTQEGPILDTP